MLSASESFINMHARLNDHSTARQRDMVIETNRYTPKRVVDRRACRRIAGVGRSSGPDEE